MSKTRNLNTSLIGYSPSLVITDLIKKQKEREKLMNSTKKGVKIEVEDKLPREEKFETCVMFADVKGFTNMTEILAD